MENIKEVLEEITEISYRNKIEICKGIGFGLQYLHNEMNIVHCHLRPENISISLDDRVKAKLFGFYSSQVVKPTHISPELIENSEISRSEDIYFFGLIICRIFFLKNSETPNEIKEIISGCVVHQSKRKDIDTILNTMNDFQISDFIPFSNLLINQQIHNSVYSAILNGKIPVFVRRFLKSPDSVGIQFIQFLKTSQSKHLLKYYGFSETNDFIYVIFDNINYNLTQFLSYHPNLEFNRKIEILLDAAYFLNFVNQQNFLFSEYDTTESDDEEINYIEIIETLEDVKLYFENLMTPDSKQEPIQNSTEDSKTKLNMEMDLIPFQYLKLTKDSIIGEGTFGVVLSGNLFKTPIAAKKIYKRHSILNFQL
jgi:hypothetical protein